jgi:hypothetical protein
MFHLDVGNVDLMLHMLQWLYTCVASIVSNVSAVSIVCYKCCICYSCYTRMLQVCFPNVSTILSECCMFSSRGCISCSVYTRMLQVYVLNISPISDVCCKCFIWILHMLQWLYTYVANVCFNCFIWFQYVCSRFCSPWVLTREYARTAHTHQRCLSQSCGPVPIVKRARNEHSVPKWSSTPRAASTATPNRHRMCTPAPLGLVPTVEHATGIDTGTRAPRTCSPVQA